MGNDSLLTIGNFQAVPVAGSDADGARPGRRRGQSANADESAAEVPLSIPAAGDDEFSIRLSRSGGVWILCFDSWHEDFHDRASAIQLIQDALSGRVRLRIDRIGGRPFKWTVERLEGDGRWIELYVSGVWRFGWSRKFDRVWRRAPKTGNLNSSAES